MFLKQVLGQGPVLLFIFMILDFEMQTPLKINSFCVLDYVYRKKKNTESEIKSLIDAVKKVNGTFSLVVHNYTFSEEEDWDGWKKTYVDLLDYAAK